MKLRALIATLGLLVAVPAVAGPDDGVVDHAEKDAGYRQLTFGPMMTWGHRTADSRARGWLVDSTWTQPLPIRLAEHLFFDLYGTLGMGMGYERTSNPPDADVPVRYKIEFGAGLAVRDEDAQAWLLAGWGGSSGLGLGNGLGEFDDLELGIATHLGARYSGLGGEIQVPISGKAAEVRRAWGVTAIIAPFVGRNDRRSGFALEFERGRDPNQEGVDANRLSLQWGLW